MSRFGKFLIAVLMFWADFASARPGAAVSIEWEPSREIAVGGYARIHRLRDGRFLCAYSHGRDACVRFGSADARNWSDERIVARGFDVSNAAGRVSVALANTEFVQLRSGRIVLGVNLRPAGQRYEVSPSAIGVTVSDDAGANWTPLKVVYRAPRTADGVRRGCWEPFFLELPNGTVQLYFADESPYVAGKHVYQGIAVMDSRDGLNWRNYRTAAYAPKCRDGMPVALLEGGRIVLALESNPRGYHLSPQLVTTSVESPWKRPVGAPSSARCRPLADAADFRIVKAGAPYLVATKRHWILSWQQGIPTAKDKEGFRTVHLAVAKRGAFGERAFEGDFTPPDLKNRQMLWNALCPIKGESFLLIGESKGRLLLQKGTLRVTAAGAFTRSTSNGSGCIHSPTGKHEK